MDQQTILELVRRGRVKRSADDRGITGHLGQLDTIRQGAVARNGLMREGAEQGGGAVGGGLGAVGGGVAGAMGAVKGLNKISPPPATSAPITPPINSAHSALRMLQNFKAKPKGAMGLTAVASLLASLGGRALGGAGGRAAGRDSIPALPEHMNNPVDIYSAPQVAGTLAKQAALPSFLRTLGKGVGMMARNPLRTAAGATGAAGVGAVGGGHLNNAAQGTVGRTMNPMTWANPQSRQQVFDRSLGQYNEQAGQQHQDITSAYGRGDITEGDKLHGQMATGNFGGNNNVFSTNPRLWGLNPFAQGPASQAQAQVKDIQTGDQASYDRMVQYRKANETRMPPEALQKLDEQLAQMRRRIDTPLGANSTGQTPIGKRPPGSNLGYYTDPNAAYGRYEDVIRRGGGFSG